jgi:hypothetical protein
LLVLVLFCFRSTCLCVCKERHSNPSEQIFKSLQHPAPCAIGFTPSLPSLPQLRELCVNSTTLTAEQVETIGVYFWKMSWMQCDVVLSSASAIQASKALSLLSLQEAGLNSAFSSILATVGFKYWCIKCVLRLDVRQSKRMIVSQQCCLMTIACSAAAPEVLLVACKQRLPWQPWACQTIK